jgi:hypothetical protein
VSPTFCDIPGSRIDLNVRDAAIGTYGFELNRQGDLTQIDSVTSGTLVQIIPEPATFALGAAGLLLLSRKLLLSFGN